jgi:RNA polymerase sigma-70 factor, ECF subfamily
MQKPQDQGVQMFDSLSSNPLPPLLHPVPVTTGQDDPELVARLRAGDEHAFDALLNEHHRSLIRIAMTYVDDIDVAEEVAQETWLAVLRGLERFEARSSMKTWIYSILVNRAKTRALREGRYVPLSTLSNFDESDEPAVDSDRFLPPDYPKAAGHWNEFPRDWRDIPEAVLLSKETVQRIREAIAALPLNQREVMTLRDIEGLTSDEVCSILGICDTNQRVLLHRARSKVRRKLELYFGE